MTSEEEDAQVKRGRQSLGEQIQLRDQTEVEQPE